MGPEKSPRPKIPLRIGLILVGIGHDLPESVSAIEGVGPAAGFTPPLADFPPGEGDLFHLSGLAVALRTAVLDANHLIESFFFHPNGSIASLGGVSMRLQDFFQKSFTARARLLHSPSHASPTVQYGLYKFRQPDGVRYCTIRGGTTT